MRIVCISDTHGRVGAERIPDGDVLLHGGDLCSSSGGLGDLEASARWLRSLPHRHKVIIAGNHDFCLQEKPTEARAALYELTYLEDESVCIEGLRIYGSPWQPRFCNMDFNLLRGPELRATWSAIPADTDVLITHGPPFGVLDRTWHGQLVGCEELALRLEDLQVGLHVFGHIHEGYGQRRVGQRLALNASMVDVRMMATQAAWVVDWDARERRFELVGDS